MIIIVSNRNVATVDPASDQIEFGGDDLFGDDFNEQAGQTSYASQRRSTMTATGGSDCFPIWQRTVRPRRSACLPR